MTDVMDFFQAMFTFKNFAPASASKQEVKLAIDLKCEAQQLAVKADEEMRNGRTTQALAFEAKDKEKVRIFTEIAVWHNGRAADKYHKAAERFEEAGRIYTKKSQAFNSKAKDMTRRAAEAEAAVNLLNDGLNKTE